LGTLALSPELKFRVRDAAASFSGSADLQILVELAVWGAVGGWGVLLASRRLASGRYSVGRLGAPGITLLVFLGVLLVSAVSAFSVRSYVRAFQMVVLLVTLMILYWESRRVPTFFLDTYRWFRRTFIGIVIVSMVISFVGNAVADIWPEHIDVDGFPRYRFFAVHPISAGGMAGVAFLMLLGTFLGVPDRPRTRLWTLGRYAGLAVLFVAVVATRSRGALAGTVVAAGVLVMMSANRKVKFLAAGGALMVIVVVLALVATPTGAEIANRVLTRGQTTEQLLSISQRTDLIDIAYDLFDQRPVFGHGYLLPGPIFSTYFEWAGHGHNLLVELAVGMGAVGLIAFFVMLVVSVVAFVAARLSPAPSSLRPVAPEMAAILLLILAMGVIGPGIAGSVGYEASCLLWFVIFADLFRWDTRRAQRRSFPSWRVPLGM
jgi:O-antigen ligase